MRFYMDNGFSQSSFNMLYLFGNYFMTELLTLCFECIGEFPRILLPIINKINNLPLTLTRVGPFYNPSFADRHSSNIN